MTIVALLHLSNSIPSRVFSSFNICPIVILGRFTNMGYTLVSAVIVALVEVFAFGNSLLYGVVLIVIGIIVSMVGPF